MVDSVTMETEHGESELTGPYDDGIEVSLHEDQLPKQLKGKHGELQRIIQEIEVPEDLPEEQNWPEAKQVKALAEVLMDAIGTHMPLRHRSIGFFFRSSVTDQGQPALGKGQKCGSKLYELSGYEFIIQINHEPYMHLPPHRKIRTIDHELCHLTLDEDDNPDVRPHDIEEFTEIARRWGLKKQQTDFGETIQQLDLLDDTGKSNDLEETESLDSEKMNAA